MNLRVLFSVAALAVLAGCVTPPQQAIQLSQGSVGPQSGRIGVAMTKLPEVETHLPGAGCLLCIAAAKMANSSLTDHSKTLTHEDLPTLKDQVAALLAKRGASAIVVSEAVNLDALDASRAEGPNLPRKDFSPLRAKYGVDKLLVIDVATLGFERSYSAYVPTSEPKGVFRATGYIVDLTKNTYDWYLPVTVLKSADKQWDEAPKFPGLTNAYYQALELGKDQILDAFK